MRGRLRSLYFLAHPDFFCATPKQQLANEAALQVIGEQLDKLEHCDRALRYGYSTTAAAAPPSLKVYLRQTGLVTGHPAAPESDKLSTADTAPKEPKEVTLTLPAAGSVEAAIDQILAQCGLPVPSSGGSSAGAGSPPAADDGVAAAQPAVVVGFAEWATELPFGAFDAMREAAGQNATLRDRNRLLSRELRRKFQLSGLANESRWSCATAERVLLTTLGSTMRKLRPPVGTSLAFAHASSGFDIDGRIVLGLHDTSDTWLAWMKKRHQHDPTVQDLHRRRRKLEDKLFGAVITSRMLDISAFYHFLQRLTSRGRRRKAKPYLSHIKVTYSETYEESLPDLEEELTALVPSLAGVSVFVENGILTLQSDGNGNLLCPIHVTLRDLLQFLMQHGQAMRARGQEVAAAALEAKQLLERTTTSMELAALTYDEPLDLERAAGFCHGLQALPRRVKVLLAGSDVRACNLPAGTFAIDDTQGRLLISWHGPWKSGRVS